MEKKYSKILLIIILLVNLFFYCSNDSSGTRKVSTNSENKALEIADIEICDFSYKYSNKDRLIWELISKKGEVFDKKGIIEIDGVTLYFYNNNKLDSTLISKFGRIDEKNGILTAISNVVLTTFDGSVLYTEILNWNDEKVLLYTDEFVKIVKGNGDIIKGVGMEADNNLEKLVIKNASGVFYEKN